MYICAQKPNTNLQNAETMSKELIHIEHQLSSKSESIIWNAISTPEGMAKWLAAAVEGEAQSVGLELLEKKKTGRKKRRKRGKKKGEAKGKERGRGQ